jgi:hypothetical protein
LSNNHLIAHDKKTNQVLLRFFRINDPYRLLGLLFILILLSLPLLINEPALTLAELKSMVVGESLLEGKLMYVELYDDTPPLSSLFFATLDFLFGRSLSARHITALLLIFFQAGFFGVLLINNKAYTENTYVPALIFAVLCFFSFDVLTTSPELLASTILLLVLNNLFKEIEFKIQRDEIILNLGVYLGLTTLLVCSYWIFLPGSVMILLIYGRLSLRRIGLLVFGFLLPHLLITTLYYYWDGADLLYRNFYMSYFTMTGKMLVSWRGILTLGAIPLVYFLFSIVMMNRKARLTKYQSQLLQVMFLWMVIALLTIWASRQFTPASLVLFVPPLAYFISYYLLLIRRWWIAETMLWLFIAAVMGVNISSLKGNLAAIDYSKLFLPKESSTVSDKKVMILGEDWPIYRNNRLGGYFLNWKLSAPVFNQLGTYDHLESVADSFETDPPEVIIDKAMKMEEVMRRIPALKSKYRKEGGYYWLISN